MRNRHIAVKIPVIIMFLAIVISFLPFITTPNVLSESLGDYFTITYDPATFSKTDILRDEAFIVTIHVTATCTDDLPPISKGYITGRVVATSTSTGHRIVLNSQYTVDIEPFPDDQGDSIERTVPVTLQFPADEVPGTYSIVGETIKSEVLSLGNWVDVTEYVPVSKTLGSVTYRTSETSNTPSPTPAPTSTPSVSHTPSASQTPSISSTPTVSSTLAASSSPTATVTSAASSSPIVTVTPSVSVTPASSTNTSATSTASSTPIPTETATVPRSSSTPDETNSPANIGAPAWTAIGLTAVLALATTALVVARLLSKSKRAGKPRDNQSRK